MKHTCSTLQSPLHSAIICTLNPDTTCRLEHEMQSAVTHIDKTHVRNKAQTYVLPFMASVTRAPASPNGSSWPKS